MEDYCDRCGNFAEGRRQWMFDQGLPSRDFFCNRCLRLFRIYAVIGFTLLGILLLGFTVAVLWLRSLV